YTELDIQPLLHTCQLQPEIIQPVLDAAQQMLQLLFFLGLVTELAFPLAQRITQVVVCLIRLVHFFFFFFLPPKQFQQRPFRAAQQLFAFGYAFMCLLQLGSIDLDLVTQIGQLFGLELQFLFQSIDLAVLSRHLQIEFVVAVIRIVIYRLGGSISLFRLLRPFFQLAYDPDQPGPGIAGIFDAGDGLLEVQLQLFETVLRSVLLRMQVLDLVLQREDEVRQPADIVLRLPDGLFLELFIITKDLVVFVLYGPFQPVHRALEAANLFLQLAQVFDAPDLLPFEKADTAARQRIFSLYIFSRLFEDNRAIAVRHSFVIIRDVNISQQMFSQAAIIVIHFDDVQGRRHPFYGMPFGSGQTGDLVEQKEIGFPLLVFIEQMNGLHAFPEIVHHVVVEIRLEHILDRRPIFLFYVDDIGKDRRFLPGWVPVQELDAFGIALHGVDQAFQQIVLILAGVENAAFVGKPLA